MSSLFSREGRTILLRKIKGFWEEFSHNKIGLVGVTLLILYIVVAVFSPWIAPYDPIAAPRVAESFAPPAWLAAFPEYADLPRTMDMVLDWRVKQGSKFVSIAPGREAIVKFKGGTTETVSISLETSFYYPYTVPPETFYFDFDYEAYNVQNVAHSFVVSLVAPGGREYRSWIEGESYLIKTLSVHLESTEYHYLRRLGFMDPKATLFAKIAFNQTDIPGEAGLIFDISFRPTSLNASATVRVGGTRFFIPGLVHGILGADHMGVDVFSQLIYGTRISLTIGLIAAVLSTSIGILVGVVSGYASGAVDEILMRIVDILLCLPVLPLLLALVFLFGSNVFYIVILIGVFGWQGLSRVIRSQVLAIRETTFVECAVASGGSKYYIMFKHIIPNVLPVALASMVLSVPGAILTEASLSFLGFGDPTAPTWGKMLNAAFGFGAFSRLAWWWAVPPGLLITFLCLAFVFVGHAVDEIVNPRLRRRR